MRLTKQEKNQIIKLKIELFEQLMIELKLSIKYELRNDRRRSSIFLLENICQISKYYIEEDIDTYKVEIISARKPPLLNKIEPKYKFK